MRRTRVRDASRRMIHGMVCRTRTAFAARSFIILLGGFPSGLVALFGQTATEVPFGNQSTPELRAGLDGFLAPSLASLQGPGRSGEQSSTPIKFDLRERYQIVARGAIGRLERLNFLIDTGSIPSMVDRRVANRLGTDVQPREIVAFGEKSRVLTTVLPSILLGPMRVDAVTAGVGDLSFLHGVDAIIGLDVLSRSSFSIDYEAKQLTFGSVASRESAIRLDVTPPFLTVQIALAGRPVRLLVDTGSGRLLLFERRVRDRLGPLSVHGEQVLYHLSGSSRLHRVSLPPLEAGETAFQHLEGFMSDAPVEGYPPEIDGVLGIRALASKYAAFDFERNRLGLR